MSTTTMPRTTFEDLVHYLSTGEDPHDRISPDVTAEMSFPHTSFTTIGKQDFDRLRDEVSDRAWVMRVRSALPVPDGFVTEIEYDAHQDGGWQTYRTITVVTVLDDRITHLSHWCTGAQV